MINYLKAYLKSMIKNEKGQGMVEYGLILVLVSIAVLVVLGTMGDKLFSIFTTVNNALTS